MTTILIAEDDAGIRDLILTTLRRRGFTVLSAVDGREAMDLIEARDVAIDVLVSDIAMPEIGGIELLGLARARRPEMALVMMSGTNRLELRSDAIASDVTLLEKPFTLQDLTDSVDAAIARDRGQAGPADR
jgi:DNA-binding NtrC family response regulator